jgi:hypothetical protein
MDVNTILTNSMIIKNAFGWKNNTQKRKSVIQEILGNPCFHPCLGQHLCFHPCFFCIPVVKFHTIKMIINDALESQNSIRKEKVSNKRNDALESQNSIRKEKVSNKSF